jgi:hypothetical protein
VLIYVVHQKKTAPNINAAHNADEVLFLEFAPRLRNVQVVVWD